MQRFRFTTSLLYTACVSCEFLTPRFPSHFLLLTAVSNVGRAVGLTTFVSTQPAFQQALCASGNMADLASKTQVRSSTARVAVCLALLGKFLQSTSGQSTSWHASDGVSCWLCGSWLWLHSASSAQVPVCEPHHCALHSQQSTDYRYLVTLLYSCVDEHQGTRPANTLLCCLLACCLAALLQHSPCQAQHMVMDTLAVAVSATAKYMLRTITTTKATMLWGPDPLTFCCARLLLRCRRSTWSWTH